MAINLVENTIEYRGKSHGIVAWQVWFMTPYGLYQERELAIKRVQEGEMDPKALVIPVSVAVGMDDIYEVFSRM